jgi:hypothetical protein
MTAIPDFTKLTFADAAGATAVPQSEGDLWQTPEDIPVKPIYTAADRDGLPFVDTLPGIAPYLRGPYPTMYVNQPWTDPAICRLLHGRGFQRLLSAQPRRRPEGTVGRLRSRHPSRL